jgi:hypothetical protein
MRVPVGPTANARIRRANAKFTSVESSATDEFSRARGLTSMSRLETDKRTR